MRTTSTIGSSRDAATTRRRRLGQRVLAVVRILLAIQFAAAWGLTALLAGALIIRVAVLGGPPVLEALFLVAAATIAWQRREQLRSLGAHPAALTTPTPRRSRSKEV